MNRIIVGVIFGAVLLAALLSASLAEPPKSDMSERSGKPGSEPLVQLPEPPVRIGGAAELSQTCLDCHGQIAESQSGDKHIAGDFQCVVCHGLSKAHLEQKVEGAMPDRAWRRWIEDEGRYRWRMKNASLEIARFCASCHARKPTDGRKQKWKTIDWRKYLETGHGVAVRKGSHDAPTCTDCHYAHGAGSEPLTNDTIIHRCSLCHADKELMKRAGRDPDVIEDFEKGAHADMESAPADKKSSCINCHPPH